MDLAQRVARAFIAASTPRGHDLTAAFLSDKWFKAKKDEMKAALAKPIGDEPEYWGWKFEDAMGQFFKKFLTDFEEIVPLKLAQDSVRNRVNGALGYMEGVHSKLKLFARLNNEAVDFTDTASYLRWYAIVQVNKKAAKDADKVGDLYKYSWEVDEAAIDRLVQKTLKAGTPDELAAITDDSRYEAKYRFLERVKFEEAAAKAIKKSKLEWDPTKWVERIQGVLAANYSEEAVQETANFEKFDLKGMKVIVQDETIEESTLRAYIKYILKAYALLQNKKLGKVWYGTVFLQPEGAGGVNYNTGGGVGGHYRIEKNTISVFSRPSDFITELMVHELGHRYWFKHMNESQRAKFSTLVRVKPTAMPPKKEDYKPKTIPEAKRQEAHDQIEALAKKSQGRRREVQVL